MTSSIAETPEERRARYSRLAIAAAAAAARTQVAGVRTAYLLLAESWSNLAKADLLPGDAELLEPSPRAEPASPAKAEEPIDKNAQT